MKKNLYIANLLVAGLMTFTGCTDGFESDNANKAGYTPELQEYDLQKYVLNLGVVNQLCTGILRFSSNFSKLVAYSLRSCPRGKP